MRRKASGSALIAVLLVLSILLVLGIGLLSQKVHQYESMRRTGEASQARALAQAGLVDVRTKLDKDITFPPPRPEDGGIFSYSEDILDVDGNAVGSYTVTVDSSDSEEPYEVLKITSVGLLGSRSDPRARYALFGEVDVALFMRDDPDNVIPNPNYFRWSFLEEGSRPIPLID